MIGRLPNVLTDFAKTSVCASSSAPPGRAHSARRGTVGGRCRPRARCGGHARHHRPRGLRRSTSTPRRYRSSGRETGRHHRVWREARPPLCRCARDHGAPRGRHRPDTRCHRVDRGNHRRATPRRAADHRRARERGGRAVRARASPADRHHIHGTRAREKKRLASKMLVFLFFFSECSRFPRTDRARGTSTAYRDRANVRARHDTKLIQTD